MLPFWQDRGNAPGVQDFEHLNQGHVPVQNCIQTCVASMMCTLDGGAIEVLDANDDRTLGRTEVHDDCLVAQLVHHLEKEGGMCPVISMVTLAKPFAKVWH